MQLDLLLLQVMIHVNWQMISLLMEQVERCVFWPGVRRTSPDGLIGHCGSPLASAKPSFSACYTVYKEVWLDMQSESAGL